VSSGVGKGPDTLEFTVPPGRVDIELRIAGAGEHMSLRRSAVVPAGGDPVLVELGEAR